MATLLHAVQDSPLGNTDAHGRTSLGGVQDKIVLTLQDGLWHRALDGHPSTHLLKPASSLLPTLIGDEAYGSLIAQHLGLAEHRTWLESFEDVDALVIQRYDRTPGTPPKRVHQEDLSQVLGVVGDQKYQRIGGRVSCARAHEAPPHADPRLPQVISTFCDRLLAGQEIGNTQD